MAMSEFEKKMLQELKGINKELHELNRTLKKVPAEPVADVQLDGDSLANAIHERHAAMMNKMVSGTMKLGS